VSCRATSRSCRRCLLKLLSESRDQLLSQGTRLADGELDSLEFIRAYLQLNRARSFSAYPDVYYQVRSDRRHVMQIVNLPFDPEKRVLSARIAIVRFRLLSRFVFILSSDDLSRPFDEDERGNDRREPYPAGYRIRLPGEIKPVPQEIDVPGWNVFPGPQPVPVLGVRLGPNKSLRERGRRFMRNIGSRRDCPVDERVGCLCARDERKELSVEPARLPC
jgi:hypothetical protein